MPTVWLKVAFPELDFVSIAMLSAEETMLICVPSGALKLSVAPKFGLDKFAQGPDLLWDLLDGLSDILSGSLWL